MNSFESSISETHLVSSEWLSKEMNNPRLVIIDVRSKGAYAAGHIPNALNIPREEYFQKSYIGNILHMLNTPCQTVKLFRENGISSNSIVLFYNDVAGAAGYTAAARGFWSAWMYGLRDIALLEGGINKWVYENRNMTKVIKYKQGNFSIKNMSLDSVAAWPEIYDALATGNAQLIDNRESAHYSGTNEDKRLVRHGHIPGAIEVSPSDLTKKVGGHYELREPEDIKSILKISGISLDKPIIIYCNTGHLASGGWFCLKFLAGAKHIKMYDGSMYEYSRMSLPIAK